MTDALLTLILVAAAFVHGAFGFGFPLVATPLLALVWPLPTAILMTLVPTIAINTASILGERAWRDAVREYWTIPVFCIIGSFIGTHWLLSVDPEPFRALLALVLLAYLVADRLRRSDSPVNLPRWALPLFGLMLGLLAGVVNIFAPLMIVFALYTRMRTELMVATFNLTFLTSKSGQVAGFLSQGAFDRHVVGTTAILLPLILLSLWIGMRLRRRFTGEGYRRVLRGFLWLVAAGLLADWAYMAYWADSVGQL